MTANRAELRHLVQGVETWSPPKEAPDDPFVYVDLSSVDRELKEITAPQGMTGAEAPSRARQLLKSGDVLVSTVRPNLNAVARVPGDLDGATGSTGFCVLRPDPDVLDSEYLFHWTRNPSFVAAMVRRATGASYPAVSDRIVKESKIPLPPLPEQRRIAAILDKADAVRRKRQQTLDLADQFLRSAFLDLFGDPITNPKHWPIKKLGEISELITDGEHLTPERTEQGVKLLSARNIKNGFVDLEEKVDHVSTQEYERLRRRVDPTRGDLLISCSGSIGRVAVLELDEPLALVRSVALVRLNSADMIPQFAAFMLRTPYVQAHMRRGSKASSQANLFQGEIAKLPVLVPPLEVQRQFATLEAQWRAYAAKRQLSLSTASKLSASLTQRAFRGDI